MSQRCARRANNPKRGQATTELAIMGSVVLVALLFLAQQGFSYNLRQGLEMYTFRQALLMSRGALGSDKGSRGVDLTVIREIPAPSFFAGISRQRAMASASVQANPFDLWTAEKDKPQDIPTYQLLQIGEGMIENGYFIRVPPTQVTVTRSGQVNDGWTTSAIREIDSQEVKSTAKSDFQRRSDYRYTSQTEEDEAGKSFSKDLESTDTTAMVMTMENAAKIKDDYINNDWEGKTTEVVVGSQPTAAQITLNETILKSKAVTTLHR